MYAETIPLESFLHVSHRTDGSTYIEEFDSIVRKERTTSKQDVSNSFVGQCPQENKMEDDQKKLRLTALSTFDSMLLLKITRKRQ